jgi:hypothetical protein
MRVCSPHYFAILNESDQRDYSLLQERFLKATEQRHRGHRLDILSDILRVVREFAQRGDPDDWRRCCVCGVCYLPSGVAINSHQLHFLTGKCKSSINGALKMMGYTTLSARGDINPELVEALPNLKGKTHDLRLWSVRTLPTSGQPDCRESDVDKSEPSAFLSKIDDCDITLNSFFNEHEELPDVSFQPFDCEDPQDPDSLKW